MRKQAGQWYEYIGPDEGLKWVYPIWYRECGQSKPNPANFRRISHDEARRRLGKRGIQVERGWVATVGRYSDARDLGYSHEEAQRFEADDPNEPRPPELCNRPKLDTFRLKP